MAMLPIQMRDYSTEPPDEATSFSFSAFAIV